MGDKILNIGIIFNAGTTDGGGFYQQISTLIELRKLEKYNFIVFTFNEYNKDIIERYNFKTILINENIFEKFYRFILRREWTWPFVRKFKLKSFFERVLEKYAIDLVYFLYPSGLSLDLVSHNYIITVWDLCHRDFPEFPEVNYYREFELREILYNKSLKKAFAIIVESEVGKYNLIKRYNIDEDRVYVIPFLPSVTAYSKNEVDVRSKYKINSEYIYYPAQFWSHKNHVYIIDALSILSKKNITITAVFSGSDKGNLAYVLDYANKKGVSHLVKYIGFVPDEEIYSLYKNALALVMPTYFGPTNIPPLEAFQIGVPVIYSDLPGLREQVGDAALLCDLNNPTSLAEILIKLKNSEIQKGELILKGFEQLKKSQSVSYIDILDNIFYDYSIKRRCWGK